MSQVGIFASMEAKRPLASNRSRNPERRQAGLEDLQTMAALAQDLSQLLFWRVLQHLAHS